ncbi:MAG: molybdopterin-dependent oxidoreductase [Mycobacteriales bacterium]
MTASRPDSVPALEQPAGAGVRRSVPRSRAGVAGALAAAMALAAGEVATGVLPDAASLVVEMADRVVAWTPGNVERVAISSVGTADKPLLVTGIVLVSILFGAVLGELAVRRFALGAAGIAAFAVLGVVVASADPRVSLANTVLVGIVAAAAGIATLRLLLRSAKPTDVEAQPSAHLRERQRALDRRGFLRAAMAAAVVASVGAVAGKLLATRERVNVIRAGIKLPTPFRKAPPVPAGAQLEVAGITPLFVPNADFYRIDTAISVPQVDTGNWSLKVRGRVDRPLQFSYDELLAMPHIEADVTLSCVSNEIGDGLVGNARWQGVALRGVLERAGVQPAGVQIMGRSVDGFNAGFPTQIAMQQPNAMIALFMNGEPLPARHGFPARLVIPGLYGYVSATKWLSVIDLTDADENGFWIPRGWSKLGPVKTQSRIDVPARSIKAGRTAIAGVAWAPTRGIARVEVAIDGGAWQEATLADALGVDAWRQWFMAWEATPGRHEITVRATDGTGAVQTDKVTRIAPNGADGHHSIRVQVSA